MNLLEIVNQCCYRTGDPTVRSVFSNEDTSREWLGYISQAAALIKEEHRWSMLKKDTVFTTSGNKKEYDLPSDFSEIASYNLYNLTLRRYIPAASDDSELMKIASRNRSQTTIRFRLMGGQIVFTYPIEDGIEIMYTYVSENIAKNNNSGSYVYKSSFSDDNDQFILDDELLILKAIALRAVNLGFPEAAQRENDYKTRLQMCMAKDAANMIYGLCEPEIYNKTTNTQWSVY